MGAAILVDQHVSGDPQSVYASWTSERELARWWWPHIGDTTYRIDPVPGGSYGIRSHLIGIGVEGEFVTLEPGVLIVMTWRWLDEGMWSVEETVRIELTPDREGTKVAVMHELADAASDGDAIHQGWVDVLARLSALYAG